MDYKNYVFCWLIAFGIVVAVASKPQSQATANDEVLQNDDYEYDDGNMPADHVKSTVSSSKSTMQPYFDKKIITKTVQPGGNITLDCPVKNLADSNVILWFKEENTITNNLNVLDNAYQVAKQNFSLIITNATESLAGNYYCQIAPQTVRMQTILRVTNETELLAIITTTAPKVMQGTSTESLSAGEILQFSNTIISLAIVLHLLLHRKYFQSLQF